MSIDLEAIRLNPGQSLDHALFLNQVSPLATYLAHPEGFELGSVVLVPTYRLEEVEEIIEPEKPGVPVEPYVGMVLEDHRGWEAVITDVSEYPRLTRFAYLNRGHEQVFSQSGPSSQWALRNYPHTPLTPAATRKVKKWVKIEHPEVPE